MSELVGAGSKYSDEDRRKAVVEYVVTGNMKLVAERTGIPRTTLVGWKKSDWWVQLMDAVRLEKGAEFDANLTKLMDAAFEQAQDRVENGDYRVGKDGKLIRVPMSGRDLVIAGATVYDKQRLHRNEPTSIKGNQGSEENLVMLAQKFKYISDHSVWNPETQRGELREPIDGECEEID